MAKVICVAQQKGGAGKTTVLVQLATALGEAGGRVAVIDTDPQGSLDGWMRLRRDASGAVAELLFSAVGGWRLGVELDRVRDRADIVLVDTPPHAEAEARGAVREADLVLVPSQPSPLDLWASRGTLELVRREGRPLRLLLNRVPPRGRSVGEAEAAIAELGVPCLDSRLGNRQAFVAAVARGLGVVESEPRSRAAGEARALAAEVAALLDR